jgi:hypothetical protein
MKDFFSFPNPVNDAAARTVALGVVAMSVLCLLTHQSWILIPLTYGFVARVLTGPTMSPLGRFATAIAAPRLAATPAFSNWEKFVPGPPKRFAQGIGAVLTISATVTWLTAGFSTARWILLPLIVAASLEGFAGYCLGCTMFRGLMRLGIIPESVCADCADLSGHYARMVQQQS